jgi:hypothetical protein
MANRKSYMELTHKEKIEFIGRVVHTIQNNDVAFDIANDAILSIGQMNGLFENVVINPPSENGNVEM